MFFRGQTVGKYKILSPLGSGGFGTVYLAEDTWIDKKVALKVPHRQQNLDFGELLREPRLLGSLNHPNIVTVLTAEKQDDVFFIVMEYVAGETLETIIIARRRARADARARLHRARSATPSITRTGTASSTAICGRATCWSPSSGLVKVADFGTSRFLEIAAHGTTVIGSPPYMAPEQFHGKAVFASRHLLARRDDVPDADRRAAVRHAVAGRPREADDAASWCRRRALQNPKIPEGDQRHRPEGDGARRSARATSAPRDLLDDILALGRETLGPPPGASRSRRAGQRRRPAPTQMQDIHSRLRARETPQPRFCWHCRKPLHARSDRCPFCGEAQ